MVLPGEPELVASVPRQGVEVVEEGAFLHVLPHERVEGGQGGLVPVVDVPRRAHFKTIYCAYIFVMSVTLLLGAIVLIGMKYEL